MPTNRFDALTKRLALTRLSRRTALRQLGAGGLAAGLLGWATLAPQPTGAQATPAAGLVAGMAANNETLFVQTASGGTLGPNPQARQPLASPTGATPAPGGTPVAATHGAYLLTLQGHNGETVAFSDRPARHFGEVPTARFLQIMGFTPVNPPNAALVVDTPQQQDAVVLLELTKAAYDRGTQTLTYEANLLHTYPNARGSALSPLATNAQTTPPAASFGSASLFLDDCPDGEIYCQNVYTNAQYGFANPVGFCYIWTKACCAPCQGYAYWADQCNTNTNMSQFCGGACTATSNETYAC